MVERNIQERLTTLEFLRTEDYVAVWSPDKQALKDIGSSYKPTKLLSKIAYLKSPMRADQPGMHTLGIDPGRNLGIAYITPEYIQVWWGKAPKLEEDVKTGEVALPKSPQLYGFWAEVLIQELIASCNLMSNRALVEGPAPTKQFGEANLAYIRMGCLFGAFYGLEGIHSPCEMLTVKPPNSIRKMAFDHGNSKGTEYVSGVNANAVAALGCALAVMSSSMDNEPKYNPLKWILQH